MPTNYKDLAEAFGIASAYDYYQNNPMVFYNDKGELLDKQHSEDALAQARGNNGALPSNTHVALLHDYLEQYPSSAYQAVVQQAQAMDMDQPHWSNTTRINEQFKDSGFETNTLNLSDLTLELVDGNLIITSVNPSYQAGNGLDKNKVTSLKKYRKPQQNIIFGLVA